MKKRRLKPAVKISLISFGVFLLLLVSITIINNNEAKKVINANDDYTYVNDYIFDSYYPVISQDEKISKPYTSEKVSIYKNFYDKDAEETEQQKSIIYHEGIYMQNSGVDYKSDEAFDVISITKGTVTNISDDPLLGKTVEVKSSTELVITYQSLSEVNVKKGDVVTSGKVIGKSGTCALNSDIQNGLHLEMYVNGSVVNPEKYYGKSLKELSVKKNEE